MLAGLSTNVLPIAPITGAYVWAAAFAWMGVGCSLNPRRCHRLHCYISAPRAVSRRRRDGCSRSRARAPRAENSRLRDQHHPAAGARDVPRRTDLGQVSPTLSRVAAAARMSRIHMCRAQRLRAGQRPQALPVRTAPRTCGIWSQANFSSWGMAVAALRVARKLSFPGHLPHGCVERRMIFAARCQAFGAIVAR